MLEKLKIEFEFKQFARNEFKKEKHSKFHSWAGQNKNKKSFEELKKLAEQELRQGSFRVGSVIKEPTDSEIYFHAKSIWNAKEINKNLNKAKKDGLLEDNLVVFQSVQEYEEKSKEKNKDNKLKYPELEKQLNKIKNGAHGFDNNTTNKSYIVVENMAKDDRLEIKTHELSHRLLSEVISRNSEAFIPLANIVMNWAKQNDTALYSRLQRRVARGETGGMIADEAIAVFLEEVAAGNVNLEQDNIGGIFGFMASNVVKENHDIDLNLGGQVDAIAMLVSLGKKIKAGTLSVKDKKALESRQDIKFAKKIGETIDKIDTADKMSEKVTPLEAINNLLPSNVTTQEDYYKVLNDPRIPKAAGVERIFDGKNLAPVIEAYIRSRSTSSEMAAENIEAVKKRLVNFDPGAKREDGSTVGSKGFGEFIFANARFGKMVAAKKLATKAAETKRTTKLDDPDVKDMADDTPTSTSETQVQNVKLRKLKDFNVELDNGLADALTVTAVNNLLDDFNSGKITFEQAQKQMDILVLKDIRAKLSETIPKIAKNKKTGKVEPTAEYEAFIRDEYDEIVASLGIKTIRTSYKKWFKQEKTGKKDYKTINPKTGKVSNYVKDTQINTTNKREYIRWFLEGKPNDLRERRTALIRRIAKRKASLAVDSYIDENSDNLEAVVKSKMRTMSDSAQNATDEQVSFDAVKFSEKVPANYNRINKKMEKFGQYKAPDGSIMTFAKKKNGNWDHGRVFEQAYNEALQEILKPIKGFNVDSLVAKEKGGYADIVFTFPGVKQYENHEIKQTPSARMGSVKFKTLNLETGEYVLANPAHKNIPGLENIVKEAIKVAKQKIKQINQYNNEYNEKYGYKKGDPEFADQVTGNEKFWIPQEVDDRMSGRLIDPNTGKKGLGKTLVKKVIQGRDVIANGYENKKVIIDEKKIDAPVRSITYGGVGSYRLSTKSKFTGLPLLDVDVEVRASLRNSTSVDNYRGGKVKFRDKFVGIEFYLSGKIKNEPNSGLATTESFMRATGAPAFSKSIGNAEKLNKAINNSRTNKYSESSRGITILDFDDTLATTESLVKFTTPGQTLVYNASSKSIKELGKRSGIIYLATDKKEADAYAKSNRGEVRGFVIDDTNIVNEDVVLKEMKDQGIDTSEGLLYEMIDSRFPDFYIGKKNVDKVFNALRKKGIKAFRYEDGSQISSKTTKSIAVIDKSAISEPGTLNAEQYASTYQDLLDQGYTFDFSDFNKVVKGKLAPLFQKALKLQNKFSPENMFVLTARPPQAAIAIYDFLKANGLNIPLKNITGLANSTAEAKALWIAEKVGEGYNDFYFADDALQNVQAVDNMLEQFDVKRKVQQAKVKFSNPANLDNTFNDILEDLTGIESKKRFDFIKARKRGAGKGKFRFFIPPSHEDFVGLLYNFMGKGRKGDAHRDFLEQALVRPLNRANREYDTARQSVATDYKNLNKQMPEVKKMLNKKTPDGDFTYQDAIRIYLWDKHGYQIPGLSPIDQKNLVELVKSDSMLQSYADTINLISKQEKYVDPTDGWDSGDIRMDLDDATGRIGREQFFAEFIENADIIFSKENLNKIEAGFGKGVRSALEDILYRIKTGRNKPSGQNKMVNDLMNWINGSVGSVMFVNIRSSLLQQMSIVNYINFADNNIFAAAKAFANQKQYWKDWAHIFNSDMLKQRRGGIMTDVNGAELAAEMRKSKNPHRFLISKLLQLGFLPTQIGDNIAIATGGATYYRNRINTYLKEGLSKKEAEEKAWTDFQDITQSTQQSARPDMVSQQQASIIGKVILNFQNVTSQFNRLSKKAFLDIKNRRITGPNKTQMQSDISNASRILYYIAIQNLIFYTLQTAMFAMMFDDDEEDVNNLFLKKRERLINGSIDSVLRGTGIYGAIVSTLKNVAIAYARQRDVNYNPDESAVLVEGLNFSPVIGIKARKIVNAEKTLNYNKGAIDVMTDFNINNPQWSAYTNYVEGFTNLPLNRLYNKTMNVRQGLNNEHAAWERTLMFLGWSQYNLNIKNYEVEDARMEAKGSKNRAL